VLDYDVEQVSLSRTSHTIVSQYDAPNEPTCMSDADEPPRPPNECVEFESVVTTDADARAPPAPAEGTNFSAR